ncbi:hypothetical protein HDU85_005007 [Gaertneriomyces sp. JEL0708]|nr:hypothetical protein HDU85_005007 [Gaertneriomyces sp. JEL0708]
MPPSSFSLRLQKGITGGFAPPTPNQVITVHRSDGANEMEISHHKRESGTPHLQSLGTKSAPVNEGHKAALIAELESLLKDLPQEDPRGSEDIYGLDTGIFWQSADFQWANAAPEGCDRGHSEVQPSEEQVAKFRRAVDIVQQLVQ